MFSYIDGAMIEFVKEQSAASANSERTEVNSRIKQ